MACNVGPCWKVQSFSYQCGTMHIRHHPLASVRPTAGCKGLDLSSTILLDTGRMGHTLLSEYIFPTIAGDRENRYPSRALLFIQYQGTIEK